MKKTIVVFITSLLMVWQVPSQSQEVHFHMEVVIERSGDPPLTSQGVDLSLENKASNSTLMLEYMALDFSYSIEALQPIFERSEAPWSMQPTSSSSKNKVRVISSDAKLSNAPIHTVTNGQVHLGIPANFNYQGNRLPAWIKPAALSWNSLDRMHLPEGVGIRLNF
jgi:hypothetical protein